jgi:hypothetical protein
MTIFSYADALPDIGRARAAHTGRAWFLMEDVASGRTRLTDDPEPNKKEAILTVFSPVEPEPDSAA